MHKYNIVIPALGFLILSDFTHADEAEDAAAILGAFSGGAIACKNIADISGMGEYADKALKILATGSGRELYALSLVFKSATEDTARKTPNKASCDEAKKFWNEKGVY